MRKIILSISFTLLLFSAFSQTTSSYDYLQAYRRFTLAGRSVKGISNDTAMLVGSADSLVTQYALKGYLAGHGIGIKGRQHQLLGAKADSTAELQYLEPLVEGAFIVSDSELNAATLVPAIYDLRNGQKWVSDNAGNFTKDTSGNTYFTDYGVRRFLYNPTTQKTFYVKPDSTYSQIGSGNVFNVHADTTINNTYVSNDNSYYYNLGDSSYLDSRDFYNDGTITSPYRIIRYDNAYIDSLFASIVSNGGTVNNYYGSKLPYNGDSTYYLGGDTIPHKLPAFTGGTFPTPLKLTTNGQVGPSTLDTATNTLNVPNYFFATSDSNNIDYSFVSMTTIYNEKGPGEYFASGHGVRVNADNTIHVFRQVKSLDVSGWNTNDYISFKNSLVANATAYTFFRAFIYLKQLVPNEQSITVQFFNNGAAVSKGLSIVNYGLNKNLVGSYMNITVPMSAFNFTSNSFDEVRFIFGGGSSPDGLYLDLVQFQNATEKENAYITDISRIPGTTEVRKTINGQDVLAFNDSVGAEVDTTSLSNRINLKLNITDTTNKWMPRNTPIVTAFNGRAGNVLPQSVDYSAYYEPTITGGTTAQFWRGDKTWQTIPIIDTQFLRRDININTAAIATKLNSNFGTQGSVLFRGATGVSQDNSFFFYDSTNHRLNMGGAATPGTINIRSTANRGDGIVVQNTNSSSGAISTVSVINNLGIGVSLQSAPATTSTLALKDRGGVIASTGLSLATDVASSVDTSDIRFYMGRDVNFAAYTFRKDGILIVRITKAQRDAIVSPPQGLMVFVTDNGGYISYYNGGWMKVTAQFD